LQAEYKENYSSYQIKERIEVDLVVNRIMNHVILLYKLEKASNQIISQSVCTVKKIL